MKLVYSLAFFLFAQALTAKNWSTETLLTGQWELAEEQGLPFTAYAKNIDPGKKYPLVIGLHGKSPSNKNGSQKWILQAFSNPQVYKEHQAILIAPLCYQPYGNTGTGWNAEPGKQTIKLIKKLIKKLPVDPDRIYLCGMSMGGGGTVHLITEEPKMFAAGIVVCGWPNREAAKVLKKVPLWAFHGSADTTVPPKYMQDLAKALKTTETFKYTEYKGAKHNIIGRVSGEEELAPWLFSQKKK